MNSRKILEFGKEFGFFEKVNIYEAENRVEILYKARSFEMQRTARLFEGIGYRLKEAKAEPIDCKELLVYLVLEEVGE